MVNKPLPANPGKIVLLNPTKYLGNLLLAGGLMQAFATFCEKNHIECRIVLDASFRELCEGSFPSGVVIWFPRRTINRAGPLQKLLLYRQTLRTLRRFKADIAFNIEEDSATSHLTRLSGARFKLGCSPIRHKRGYDHVLPVAFENRKPGQTHRWHSFYEVFAALGMPSPKPGYIDLRLPALSKPLHTRLEKAGWDSRTHTIALHAGATKEYKKWPLPYFIRLTEKMTATGFQVVLLGAGEDDQRANRAILDSLAEENKPVDLCNKLSLFELAQFLPRCEAMVGNDSGPFHLGSALGVKGYVLWGPTNRAIWGPLGHQCEVITGQLDCDPACNKGACLHNHRCLQSLDPDTVFERVINGTPHAVSEKFNTNEKL